MTALPTADVLFEEASGWYFRLHAEDLTPAEMDAFAAWLGQLRCDQGPWTALRGAVIGRASRRGSM